MLCCHFKSWAWLQQDLNKRICNIAATGVDTGALLPLPYKAEVDLPAIFEGFPGTRMKSPANPELYRGGKDPFQQFIQGEAQQVGLEEGFTAGHHGQNHCKHEDRQGEGTAVAQQAAPVLQLSSAVICPERSATKPESYTRNHNLFMHVIACVNRQVNT